MRIRHRFTRCLALSLPAAILGIGCQAAWADEIRQTPLSPADEAATFVLADERLTVELVASEPQLDSPVAVSWDADGRMIVAEMIDYPVGPTAGRIRLLEDRDHDGRYEHASVFAEGLRFPNGVLVAKGGVFVTAAPDLLFLKDNDGDGRADETTVVLTGFGEGNQQLRCNGLVWGLDGWIYGANGRSDGAVRRPSDSPEAAVSIRTRDFRFLPDGSKFEATSGQSQFSQARDDWGNRFLAWNTVPIRHAVLGQDFLDRNPRLNVQGTIDIADPADDGRVFPISPRPQTFNRERTDYYNALCGLTIFRGDALGPEYEGNAFVGESLTSLVHRRVLSPAGPTFVSRRGEQEKEFLAARDPWFHPVYMTTGPDGALYIVDFYRRWVEHPAFVAEKLRTRVDFRQGAGHGRIWRVVRRDLLRLSRDFAPLTSLSLKELAEQLASPNGWRRDAAQRLLTERRDTQAALYIRPLAIDHPLPKVRAQALATLDTMGLSDTDSLRRALADPDARVRRFAVRQSVPHAMTPGPIRDALLQAIESPDAGVRFEIALALARWQDPRKLDALVALAHSGADDPLVATALAGSLGSSSAALVERLLDKEPNWRGEPTATQMALLKQAAEVSATTPELASALVLLTERAVPGPGDLAVWVGLHQSLPGRHAPQSADPPSPGRDKLRQLAEQWIAGDARPLEQRLVAVEALPLLDKQAGPLLVGLLEARHDVRLQQAAARALVGADERSAQQMLAAWPNLATATRRALIASALRWPAGVAALLSALEDDRISLQELDPAIRDALAAVPEPQLKARAKKLIAAIPPPPDRQAVLARYEPELKHPGDRVRGAALFEKLCLTCHHVQGRGQRVGPDLSGIGARPKETLLVDVLDPNRQIADGFVAYTLVTRSGQVFNGLLAAESAGSITLRRAEGAQDVVPRDEIEEFRRTGKSLMPEGLENQLQPQDLADLLTFLAQPEAGLFSPAK